MIHEENKRLVYLKELRQMRSEIKYEEDNGDWDPSIGGKNQLTKKNQSTSRLKLSSDSSSLIKK